MKILACTLSLAVLLTLLGGGNCFADDHLPGTPAIVPAPIANVFVPQGFDDNDAAEIVVHGKFKNSCFSVGPVSAEIDRANHEIEIFIKAYRYDFAYCMDIPVAFTRKIPLSILATGTYKVRVSGFPEAEIAALPIARAAVGGPDDFFYAPVTELRIDEAAHAIEIEGAFPNNCVRLREVRIEREAGNILVIRPIADFADNGNCEATETHFSRTLQLRPDILGTHLIYVRTMNGDSLARTATFR